jgi:hypothetical protein
MADESPDIFAESSAETPTETTETVVKDDAIALEVSDEDADKPDDKDATKEEKVEESSDDDKLQKEIDDILAKTEKENEDIEEDEEPLLNRLSLKELTKKYPNIHKEFPDLREMYFREKQYTEVFPTIETAKEASAQLIALHSTVKKAVDGNAIGVLQDLANINQESVVKFVDNILPQLRQVSPDLLKRAVLPEIRQVAIAMVQQGQASGNENLIKAAQWVSQFLFNDPNLPELNFAQAQAPRDPEKEQLQAALETERRKQATSFIESVNQDSKTFLRGRIAKELGSPADNGLPAYVYNKVIDDCIAAYESQVERDPQFNGIITAKWREILSRGSYDKIARTKILSAFLGRANAVIPLIARKKLAEAKGTNVIPMKKPATPETGKPKSKSVNANEVRPEDIDYSKTTDQDLFEDRIYLKKK